MMEHCVYEKEPEIDDNVCVISHNNEFGNI